MLRVDRNGQSVGTRPPISFHPNSMARVQSQDNQNRASKKRADMQLATKFANQLDSDLKQSDEKRQTEQFSPAQNNSFQSFLLSKHLAKPELPNNANVYRAISNERKLWAQPPKNTAFSQSTNTSSSIVIGDQNKLDVYKGSQRPVQHKPQKRKREIRGIPSGHKPVINYKNQSEIMQKIFGSSQAYQDYKNLADGNPTPSQIQHAREDVQVEFKAHSFESPYNNSKLIEQIQSVTPVVGSGQRSNNPQQKVEEKSQLPNQRTLPAQNSNRADKVQDDADRAFLELQNAKSAFVFENQEFQQKQTKSHSNGFMTTKTTQSSIANNQPKINENLQLRTTTNFFNPAKDRLINEDVNLSVQELKEKLFVAEKVMKSLFERNKELELGSEQKNSESKPRNCQNCEHLKDQLAIKTNELAISTGQQQNQTNSGDELTTEYKKLLQNTLQSAQEQAKIHLNQYIDVRNQLQEHLLSAVQIQQDAHEKSKDRKLYLLMKQAKQIEVSRDQSYEKRMALLEKTIEAAEQQFKGFDQKIKQKEQQNQVLKDEITRRKYIEAKVQSYVATLIQQNTKLKEGLQWIKQQSSVSESVKEKCDEILQEPSDDQQSENQDDEEDSNEISATEI